MTSQDQPAVPPQRSTDSTISLSALNAPTEQGEAVEHDTVGVTAEDQRAISALPGASALLIVQRGPNSGSRFLLDADRTTAGRHPDSEIFLDDVTVSRRHAEFLRASDGFHVRDVGSLNGTYVNRQRVDDALPGSGDEVQIGKYRMTFHPHP